MVRSKIRGVFAVFLTVSLACIFSPAASGQSGAAAVYTAKCAACHGPDGTAATPAGKAVMAHDFHSPEVQNQTDAQLSITVAKGKNKMPAYEKALTEAQIKDLVAYCRDLGKKK